MRGKTLHMRDGGGHALAAEALERPDESNSRRAASANIAASCFSVLGALSVILVLDRSAGAADQIKRDAIPDRFNGISATVRTPTAGG